MTPSPPSLRVDIRHDRTTGHCDGPDATGACSVSGGGAPMPCAGAQLAVRCGPEDLWLFTAAPAARDCPLGWLVTAADGDAFEHAVFPRRPGARSRRWVPG